MSGKERHFEDYLEQVEYAVEHCNSMFMAAQTSWALAKSWGLATLDAAEGEKNLWEMRAELYGFQVRQLCLQTGKKEGPIAKHWADVFEAHGEEENGTNAQTAKEDQ